MGSALGYKLSSPVLAISLSRNATESVTLRVRQRARTALQNEQPKFEFLAKALYSQWPPPPSCINLSRSQSAHCDHV